VITGNSERLSLVGALMPHQALLKLELFHSIQEKAVNDWMKAIIYTQYSSPEVLQLK
jgi:hypothetical protein